MKAEHTNIWLPDSTSRNAYDIPVLRCDKAAQEYDPALRFGRNTDTGQWCIYLQRAGLSPLPVLGFDEMPHPEDIPKKLYQVDAVRRGNEILDEMNAENKRLEDLENAPMDAMIDAAGYELAERIEHIRRTTGKTRYSKSFRPRSGRNMGGYS